MRVASTHQQHSLVVDLFSLAQSGIAQCLGDRPHWPAGGLQQNCFERFQPESVATFVGRFSQTVSHYGEHVSLFAGDGGGDETSISKDSKRRIGDRAVLDSLRAFAVMQNGIVPGEGKLEIRTPAAA